jgi:hypothetical protein
MPKKNVICDRCYNMHKQMAKKAEFLWHTQGYLKDAKKASTGSAKGCWKG